MKEETAVSTPPPKLSLNSSFSSSKRADQKPETWSTPPLQHPGAIPFTWEEVPGKPKQPNKSSNQVRDAEFNGGEDERRLELPPRLSASASERRGSCRRFNIDHTSPTSVLNGPYSLIRRAASLRFGRKTTSSTVNYWDVKSEEDALTMSMDSFSSSSSKLSNISVDESREDGDGDNRKVRILRYRKKKPVFCLASHFLDGVFGKMKHAMVPYRKDHN